MLSLQLISLRSNPPSSPEPPILIRTRATSFSQQLIEHEIASAPLISQRRRRSHCSVVRAVEKNDSRMPQNEDYEIDEDKAREALEQLDRQLQSLSQRQVPTSNVKASDVKLSRDQMIQEEAPDISGSFLAYTTVALVIFTVFYNVLFLQSSSHPLMDRTSSLKVKLLWLDQKKPSQNHWGFIIINIQHPPTSTYFPPLKSQASSNRWQTEEAIIVECV